MYETSVRLSSTELPFESVAPSAGVMADTPNVWDAGAVGPVGPAVQAARHVKASATRSREFIQPLLLLDSVTQRRTSRVLRSGACQRF